jgi:uncharacterized protein
MNRKLVSRKCLSSVFLLAVATACVTVNVNFPESTVQKATDDVVRELYQSKDKGREGRKPPAPVPGGGPGAGGDPVKPSTSSPTSWLPSLIPSAMAAEADLNFKTDTAKATELKKRLAANVDTVLAQKKAGNLGESNDGLLVLKTDKPLLVKKLEPMVKAENADREDLYQEILTANQMAKGRLSDIRKSFARSFQGQSPAGTWVQDADGAWTKK